MKKSNCLFVAISLFAATFQSCTGVSIDITYLSTVEEGVVYSLDNDNNTAEANGYRVVDGEVITRINLPETLKVTNITYEVTSVASKAFAGLNTCEGVKIASSLSTIGDEAFIGCTSIRYVELEGTKAPAIRRNVFEDETYATATLILDADCDIAGTAWTEFANVIKK